MRTGLTPAQEPAWKLGTVQIFASVSVLARIADCSGSEEG